MGTKTRHIWEIKIEGVLDPQWAEWFNGMTITSKATEDGLLVTTLTGPTADQAALRGILCKLLDLNLTLISTRRIEANSKEEHENGSKKCL